MVKGASRKSKLNTSYDLKHVVLLNLSTLMVASSAIFAKLITLNAAEVVLFRCLIAGIFLGIFLKLRGLSIWRGLKEHPGFYLLTGFLLGLHWVLLFWAIKVATVSLAILAVFTFPVITTLLEPVFLKIKLIRFNLLTASLTLVGIGFLVPQYNLQNKASLGVLLGVLAALLIAIRNLLCKKYIERISSSEMMFYQLWVSFILLLPVLFWGVPALDAPNILYLLSMGLVTTALGHTLFVYCLKFFPTSTASIVVSIQPFYGILLAMLILKETPSPNTFIGGALIVGTVLLENIKAGLRANNRG
jgi:drug/metabolite transporter (DMT)-like permease